MQQIYKMCRTIACGKRRGGARPAPEAAAQTSFTCPGAPLCGHRRPRRENETTPHLWEIASSGASSWFFLATFRATSFRQTRSWPPWRRLGLETVVRVQFLIGMLRNSQRFCDERLFVLETGIRERTGILASNWVREIPVLPFGLPKWIASFTSTAFLFPATLSLVHWRRLALESLRILKVKRGCRGHDFVRVWSESSLSCPFFLFLGPAIYNPLDVDVCVKR